MSTVMGPELSWDERLATRQWGHVMRLLGVPGVSDAELGSYTPREIALHAGYGEPDETASEFIGDLLENYIDCDRPDAYALAQDALDHWVYVQDVARVLAGFAGEWWREPLCEVLAWRESDKMTKVSVGDVLTATYHKVALDLAGAILALDGRLSTGEDA